MAATEYARSEPPPAARDRLTLTRPCPAGTMSDDSGVRIPRSHAPGCHHQVRQVRQQERAAGDPGVSQAAAQRGRPVAGPPGLEHDSGDHERRDQPRCLLDRHGQAHQHRTAPGRPAALGREAVPARRRADQERQVERVGDAACRVGDIDVQAGDDRRYRRQPPRQHGEQHDGARRPRLPRSSRSRPAWPAPG